MDSSDSTHKNYTRRISDDDAKDIISNLDEFTLSQILSFLPTIEAVHTCVLSRRWIHLWKSITALTFDDCSLVCSAKMRKEKFVHFVNRVVSHFSGSRIQSFNLYLTSYNYDPSIVSEWICFALRSGVQNLRIQYADEIQFPSNSLFKCTSLLQLLLQLRCDLSVPNYAIFPNLENIRVSGVRFMSDASCCADSKELVLKLPVLKALEARGCEWLTMQDIIVEAPLLETFSMAIWNSCVSNDEPCKPCSIKVFAPSLTHFSYEGDLQQDVVLLDPSSLRSASVVIVADEDHSKDKMEIIGFQVSKFLSQIHRVERLKLLLFKALLHGEVIFNHLPAFGRLTYLQLNEVTGEALLNLLHNSPIINTLVLLNGVSNLNKDALDSTSVPDCFHSSLTVFKFKEFNAKEAEMCLAKFVTANAAVLEQMAISTAFWLRYSDIMEKVKQQILSLPKCSSFAKIEIS